MDGDAAQPGVLLRAGIWFRSFACIDAIWSRVTQHYLVSNLCFMLTLVMVTLGVTSQQTLTAFAAPAPAASNTTAAGCLSGIIGRSGFDGSLPSGIPDIEQAWYMMCCLLILGQVSIMTVSSWHIVSEKHNVALVSAMWLAEMFLSLTFLFAGCYYMLWLSLGPNSFHLVQTALGGVESFTVTNHTDLLAAFYEFCYFSVTVSTTTGLGDVFPLNPAARFLVCTHAMMAYFFNIVVFGLGVSHLITQLERQWTDPRPRQPK